MLVEISDKAIISKTGKVILLVMHTRLQMLHFVHLQTVKTYLLLFPAYIHFQAKVTFYNYKDLGQNTATSTLILKHREHFCPTTAQISLCE